MMTTTMIRDAIVGMVVVLAALTLMAALAAQAADAPLKGTMKVPSIDRMTFPKGNFLQWHPGQGGDTLTASHARISESASAGQRMLAEQSCADEEKVRNAVRSAPTF